MQGKPVAVGKGFILVTSEDFLNGYQAGHLEYRVNGQAVTHSDEQITDLFFEKLEDMENSSLYGIGFAVGWLHTLASGGTTNHAASVATPPTAPLEGYTIEEEGK